MNFSFRPFFYRRVIDPMLSGLHRSLLVHVESSHRVLDVACGTGTLALMMAGRARQVTGIDISEEFISAARQTAQRRRTNNAIFEIMDATEHSVYTDKEFDIAVTSMAIHQFDVDLAIKILVEMKRVSSRVIIADYNSEMGTGWKQSLAWFIEKMAAGDHYRNFRTYMQLGGTRYFTRRAGIKVISEAKREGDVFTVTLGN